MEERIEIIADALVEAVQGTAFLFRQYMIAAEWREQTCGERRVDFFEQLQEDNTDRVALGDQPIAPGARHPFDEPLARSLERS